MRARVLCAPACICSPILCAQASQMRGCKRVQGKGAEHGHMLATHQHKPVGPGPRSAKTCAHRERGHDWEHARLFTSYVEGKEPGPLPLPRTGPSNNPTQSCPPALPQQASALQLKRSDMHAGSSPPLLVSSILCSGGFGFCGFWVTHTRMSPLLGKTTGPARPPTCPAAAGLAPSCSIIRATCVWPHHPHWPSAAAHLPGHSRPRARCAQVQPDRSSMRAATPPSLAQRGRPPARPQQAPRPLRPAAA